MAPKIDIDCCVGCGTCAQVCPQGVWEIQDDGQTGPGRSQGPVPTYFFLVR